MNPTKKILLMICLGMVLLPSILSAALTNKIVITNATDNTYTINGSYAYLSGYMYINPLDDLNNASRYENVTIYSNNLGLDIFEVAWVPNDKDHWTETNSSINGTISQWVSFDNPDIDYSIAYNFNCSTGIGNNSLNATFSNVTYGDWSSIVLINDTSFSLEGFNYLDFYMKIAINFSTYEPWVTLVGVQDINGNITGNLYSNTISNDSWIRYRYSLEEFTQDLVGSSFNWSIATGFVFTLDFENDVYPVNENWSLYIDNLHFTKETYYPSGVFISDWISPPTTNGIWSQIIVQTTNETLTNVYVSQNNVTWYQIGWDDIMGENATQNLKNLNLDGNLPLLYKLVLLNGSTPLIDIVIISYDSIRSISTIFIYPFEYGGAVDAWLLVAALLLGALLIVAFDLSMLGIRRVRRGKKVSMMKIR
jgi:hypothetical protein